MPGAALPPAFSVRVEEPDPATVLGLKLPVTPAGIPETLRPTVPVKPPSPPTVTLAVALPPGTTQTEGVEESVKFEALEAVMFRVTDTICVRLPLVPVTVKG